MDGKVLRKIREDSGLRSEVFADRAGCTRQNLYELEKGRNVSVRALEMYAQAAGIKPGDLLPNSAGDLGGIAPLINELKEVPQERIDAIAGCIRTLAGVHPAVFPRLLAMVSETAASLESLVTEVAHTPDHRGSPPPRPLPRTDRAGLPIR